jgi:hypothetical protein
MADHLGACAAELLPLCELIKTHVFAAKWARALRNVQNASHRE